MKIISLPVLRWRNQFGELGDGTTTDRLEPIMIDCVLLEVEDYGISHQVNVYPNPIKNIVKITTFQNEC